MTLQFSLFKLSFYKKVCAFFCYFSCASKKSNEYKQKEKYKFTLIAYIYFTDTADISVLKITFTIYLQKTIKYAIIYIEYSVC